MERGYWNCRVSKNCKSSTK